MNGVLLKSPDNLPINSYETKSEFLEFCCVGSTNKYQDNCILSVHERVLSVLFLFSSLALNPHQVKLFHFCLVLVICPLSFALKQSSVMLLIFICRLYI